jgi:hypothetical protein
MPFDNRLIRILPLAVTLLGGCKSLGFHTGSKPVEATRKLAGFEAVTVAGGVAVDIALGDAFSVTVDAPPALAQKVETRVEKAMLLVAVRPRLDPKSGPVRVRVVMPRLTRVQVEASSVTVAAGEIPQLDVVAREGGIVNVGGVKAERLLVEGRGASRIVVAGAARTLECVLAGASRGDARDLAVGTARVSLAEASRLDLRPRQMVSGEATGASKLAVWGKPKRMGVATRDGSSVTFVR